MKKIIIKNQELEVTVLTLGAIVNSIKYKGTELALGYATEEEYFNDTCYFGGTIGRCANRCGEIQYLNNTEYRLTPNEKGINHLHGGAQGFNLKRWTVTEKGDDFVTLFYLSPDGEEGYSGNLSVYVTYKIIGSDLVISYKAKTDKPTWVNLTNHSYFNPFGVANEAGAGIAGAGIRIDADFVSVYDENNRVIGKNPVDDSEFDLRKGAVISILYDHNFYLSGNDFEEFLGKKLRKAATLIGSVKIECFTDLPCIQLYCGEYIPENTILSGGIVARPSFGLALETQLEPNLQARGEGILNPNEEYSSSTAYRFSKGSIRVSKINKNMA